ncbi:hypothetical protein KR018_006908 [Drosophila ironensis]|nr:hypothetical protein KR018_006908 [Drosophila ironensis]
MAVSSGGSWISAVLDEVALEGLEGVTLPYLWGLLARRFKLSPQPLSERLQQQVWTLLLRSHPHKVEFFELPESRPDFPHYDRLKDMDEDLGVPVISETCPFQFLVNAPVQEDGIMGNCADFKTRKPVPLATLQPLTVAQATEQWGGRLVVVASQELRRAALSPGHIMLPKEIALQNYVFLEAVGRSRHNGHTTAGPWSLSRYCKDAGIVSYIKTKLLSLQLITTQMYIESNKGRLLSSSLLMLPRFHRLYKNHTQENLAKLYLEIVGSSERYVPVAEICARLGNPPHLKTKKLLVTHVFRKFFETAQVERPVPQPLTKNGNTSRATVRKVVVVRLRNPDMQVNDIYQVSSEAGEEKTMLEFLDFRHSYLDIPPEEEATRAVTRFGERGLTAYEISKYTAVSFNTTRHFIKHMQKIHDVKVYSHHLGKSRQYRFVAKEHVAAAEKIQSLNQLEQDIACKEEPNVPINMEIPLKDMPEITATVRPVTFKLKLTRVKNQTQRLLDRQKLTVRLLDETCIVHLYRIQKQLQEEERRRGFKDTLCRRSLQRLLLPMMTSGKINVFEVTLQYDQRVRLYRFATHPKIDIDHVLLRREILKLKSNFHLVTEERMKRPSQLHPRERKELLARRKQQNAERPPSLPIAKTQAPKLLLARTLHEFLYYLLHELPPTQKPLEMTPQLVQQWQKTEPSLQPRQYLEEWRDKDGGEVRPYTADISWRTFIPPLPRSKDKPQGWFYFMDAMDRMPLSLFLRICRIDREANDQLRLQLQHPVRQHYLLPQLRLESVVPRLKLQQLYVSTLRLLSQMGLIQVSERKLGRDSLQRWVYLNHRTRLLDTTSSTEHNYKKVSADRTYTRLDFEFTDKEQVAQYWAKLQHICIYTKLGYRNHLRSTQGSQPAPRLQNLAFQPPVEFEQAPELDNASVPGDSLGAAGLGSHLYAHQFRHWSWVQRQNVIKTAGGRKKAKKLLGSGLVNTKRSVRVKMGHRPSGRRQSSAQAKKKAGPRDDIDRDALRNMRTLRVSWTPEEDRILWMGRAVYTFIDAPILTLALCDVGVVCRDLIRRYLGICNKTTQAVVRRVQFILKTKRDAPDLAGWIYMMQTHEQFTELYNERFLSQLKREYPNKSEFHDALMIHFVLVMTKLHRIVAKSLSSMRTQFLLPDAVDAIRGQCRVAVEEPQLLFQDPATETELNVAVAHSVLHSTVCCSKDKTLLNLQTFEIYKHFSEEVLNAAFNKARADSLIVAVKRRNIQLVSSRQITGPGHLLSSKYRYRLIYAKLTPSVFESYYALNETLHSNGEQQLSSPHFAQLLLIGEWLAHRRLVLSLQLPANILTVDTSTVGRQSSCATDRILDHYSCIFDNAPQTEYAKRLETEASGRSASRVYFHPANLSYRLPASAYNQLSKMQLRSMHFFCALDALGETITLSQTRLEQGDCPFANCIMRSGNYLNAVERIAHEQRPILRQVMADALPSSQLEALESLTPGTALTVSVSNFLAFAHQLEAYWRRQQQPLEVKDLGKALAEDHLGKLTDWRSLCAELLEDETHAWETDRVQEYEPALNKEERARVQDVFVVHLPTIGVRCIETMQQQQRTKRERDATRIAVLEKVMKAAHWLYTENTFDTLRPNLQAKGFNASAIRHMEDIHDHIEKYPLGVQGLELRRMFPLGDFLLESLRLLAEHNLIKRVGVASHMYVHKQHIRNWVVHTFHITRLERERVQPLVAAAPSTLQAVVGQKRKLEALEAQEDQEAAEKKAKLSERNSTDSESDDTEGGSGTKRPRRNVRRREPSAEKISPPVELQRDTIAMRPQPWIRVNASLNRRVLDRWLTTVLSDCIARIGCTVYSLFLRFSHLVPVDIMFLLELLDLIGCLHLMEIRSQRVHVEPLLDEDEEQPAKELYDPAQTYVQVHGDAIGRLTSFIGLKKYSSEFI